MHGPKKILVGTDLSESSKAALATAAFYAKTFDADVVLASVFDPTPFVAPSVIRGPRICSKARPARSRSRSAKRSRRPRKTSSQTVRRG
ncbi:MAG: universal stress protein [Sandaracinus sp.]|nr:universal stress protein [Sandaracinus sp.]